MQLSIATTLVAFFGLAAAVPLEARAPEAGATICSGENFTGECIAVSIPYNECQKVPAALAGNIGSFTLAGGALCRIT